MSARVYIPSFDDEDEPLPVPVAAPLRVVDGSVRARRSRGDRAPSALAVRSFSLGMGASCGAAVGLLGRNLLALGGLSQAALPSTLGFASAAFGLSFCHLLARLMERARGATLRVQVAGAPQEVPLRRRPEVVRRALGYLCAILVGFGVALLCGWLSLRETVPALRGLSLTPTPELLATLLAMGAALVCLAFCEWSLRLVRKEGHPEQAHWVVVPAMLALGATLAGVL